MRTSSPIAGTLIDGKYRVERMLGEGGMGVVVEATHVTLGTRVAVKLLRAEVADADVRERFAREGQIAAQLAGEHIARVTDIGQTQEGDPYLVMEFLVGRDLAVELEARKTLPIAEAIDLVLQACEGVAEAHAVGLVHRDLKPANLFLVRRRDGSPLVKVLDFGLSKVLHGKARHLTASATTFGTPQYMSPEQIASSKHVDPRTDQHALAMVLYELITGAPAYEAESVPALFVAIATRAPEPMRRRRPDVAPGLDAAVLRALAKSPGDRFPNLAALGAALAPFGSAAAAASARRIAVTLTGPAAGAAASEEPPRLSGPPPLTDDQSATLKRVDPRTLPASMVESTTAIMEADTHSPVESDPRLTNGGKSRRLIVFGAAAAALGIVAILLVRGVGSTGPAADAPAPPTSSADPRLAPSSAPVASPGMSAAPEGTASPALASAAPSTSAASVASAAASARSPHPPRGKGSGAPRGDGALEIFGTKRK